jgi:DNA-binding XRE family transcriptional regulator
MILEVTESTVMSWEKNRSNSTLRLMPRIIEFLGYDPVSSVPKNLGEKLCQYRKSHGLNQKQLAKMIGIDPTTLSRLERNCGRRLQKVLKKSICLLSSVAE